MATSKSIFAILGLALVLLTGACAGGGATAVSQTTDSVALASADSGHVKTAFADTVTTSDTASGGITAVATGLAQQLPPTNGFEAILAQQQAFINIYNQANPSVVNIQTNTGEGSGFVFDKQGHIVTNNHVVAGASQLRVTFSDGQQAAAKIVGRDPNSDLAVIKIDPAATTLVPIALSDSDNLQVGQIVIAIGSPFGLQSTMTTGIISALDRLFEGSPALNGQSYSIPNIIQTDAAVNPGNSGGPLLDIYGNVIGVNTAIESPVRGSSGIGLAVPSNIVAVVVPQLIDGGRVATPWLGISGIQLSAAVSEELGLSVPTGILIREVVAGGPAAQAGLVAADANTGLNGDIIVGIDGQSVAEFDDLLGYIVQQTAVGQTVTLNVIRNGQTVSVPLTLAERPSS